MKLMLLFILTIFGFSCQKSTSVDGNYYPNEYRSEFNISTYSQLTLLSSSLKSLEETTVYLNAYDENGSPMSSGGGKVYFFSEGDGSVSFSNVIDHGNGQYSSVITAQKIGVVRIKASLNPAKLRRTVGNEELTINVGDISLEKSSVNLDTNILLIGTSMNFTLTIKDGFGNLIDDNSLLLYTTLLNGTSEASISSPNYLGNGQYQGSLTGTVSGSLTQINVSIRRVGSVISNQYFQVIP